MTTFRALKGIEIGGQPYVTGDVIHDLPKVSAEWLLGRGAIELIEDEAPAAPKTSKKKGA